MTTEVVKDPQNGLIEFFHIITLIKPTNWDQSTEVPVDHHFLNLLRTKIISKVEIYRTIGFTVH